MCKYRSNQGGAKGTKKELRWNIGYGILQDTVETWVFECNIKEKFNTGQYWIDKY